MNQEIKIAQILSMRDIKTDLFRDIVYEWEDSISANFGYPVKNIKPRPIWDRLSEKNLFFRAHRFLGRTKKIKKLNLNKEISLTFVTLFFEVEYVKNTNCIPVFIDVWPDEIKFLYKVITEDTLFFVTSLDIYQMIKNKNPRYQVHYLPLSISEIWDMEVPLTEKKVDILQIGRRNDVLHDFALRYCQSHPDVDYVYSGISKTLGGMVYYSTVRGILGTAETREKYMKLLRSAKIFMLSSPGVDRSKIRAQGIDFPTPRFYEAAACKCFLVGRYTPNEEFTRQGITSVCKNVQNYSEFEAELDEILSGKRSFSDEYKVYLTRHLTTSWYRDFLKELNG